MSRQSSSRRIAARGAVALGVGSMVGAGIFALMGEAVALAGSAVWLSFGVAGIIALLMVNFLTLTTVDAALPREANPGPEALGDFVRSTCTGPWALAAVFALGVIHAGSAGADECHPAVDPSKPQYIVGYGSLMQSASKRMTEPDAGINLPILVTGFQRAWNTHGVYPTTYLGVRRSGSARMAAALYRSFLKDGKLGADAREIDYCRAAVATAAIEMLDGSSVPTNSQIWIYVNKPESLAPPDAENPIVQSYMDIFITGCMELQARVSEPDLDFVEQCVKTTDGWSKHWVNDRLYPRRPYIHQPRAWEIDQHLKRLLPELVKNVRVE